jgi:hypothetical protein
MITSPYIGAGGTKEQRQKQMENLKKHVHAQMNKGTAAPTSEGDIKDRLKIAPIANAFSVEFKN